MTQPDVKPTNCEQRGSPGSMIRVAAFLSIVLLAGCGSGLGPNTKAWCGEHLDAVAAEGTSQGTIFAGGHSTVSWSEYLKDGPVEQALVTSEAKDGQAIWDKACQPAFLAAHPGSSPEPTRSR